MGRRRRCHCLSLDASVHRSAAAFGFGVYRKYAQFPGLIMTYATGLRHGPAVIFAMPYDESIRIADTLGWSAVRCRARGERSGLYDSLHPVRQTGALMATTRSDNSPPVCRGCPQ